MYYSRNGDRYRVIDRYRKDKDDNIYCSKEIKETVIETERGIVVGVE